jgi:MOSC domain-containing protein YiiM
MEGKIVSVSRGARHGFSKEPLGTIHILAGLGVEGDAHAGVTVKHRYLVRKNPNAPNLCQVHLLQAELFEELRAKGFEIAPGEMGENVTTLGLDLLSLPLGTKLHLGPEAIVEVTGLRTPCTQMDKFRPGLMKACLDRADDGSLVRKAGIMGVALIGGTVSSGDRIEVEFPTGKWVKLAPV